MTVFAARPRVPVPTFVMAIAASLLTFGLFGSIFVEVWRHGTFFDSDDAMRMVQARALAAGQSWFDLTAYRLDPQTGVSMHWSRVVDVPIVLLLKVFGLFVGPALAEALTRMVLPFALLCGLFAGVASLACLLFGRVARLPAVLATALNGVAIVQFEPGRIDHHAPQIVTLVLMVWAALRALDPAKARSTALAGALAALSLSISLENLPFVVGLIAMLVAIWVWHGATMDRMLRALALGLGGGLIVLFAATVAPDRWFAPVCDAFGAAHLGAGLIGAAGCVALSVASSVLPTRAHRLAAAGAVACLVGLYVSTAYPACLHDPFAAVDPLVRDLWLSKVGESQPLLALFRETPMLALLYSLPVALGLIGCGVAVFFARGVTALRLALLTGVVAIGFALAFWQIRVLTSTTPLAVMGALPLAVGLHDRYAREHGLAAALALGLVLPFTTLAWALVLPDDPPSAARPAHSCLAAGSFAPLARLAPGSVVAPVDAGSFLLAHTNMTVFAAPYHRDNDGNRFAFDVFLATPEVAARLLAARGVTYVMTCPGLAETNRLAERAPDSLAAGLLEGRIPTWLVPVSVESSPYTVFKVAAEKN